ncbi:hypothetical protein NW761_002005 [Fusarium oxysporum]|uniref:Uncharacterized protein n=3 Tax=Fusarium oxysporum TaxID=5507 RepID=N4TPV3_FUSC1|nr:hypothetical protein FOXB_09582 [Fusarium oxysporum f. sp. conglutinans Fo5176]ENH61212.1 hypothetical protein FOC1_g10016023 [Fusarium oxysporum f. sp. cubense race 1]KAH7218952.1 hypothetical protein DER44DRAFT_818388 [Fusarium oxysporum]KAJ4059945.1 hypothetical protein NW758_000504 [Fusarium oxysporum]KAJ4103214.1 hypothetical protein NW761_002005 [Fusarium oxysporum]
MSSVAPHQGSAVGVAVEARQEAPELSQNRVAPYSHDNVFARIQSRGANNGHVAGGQPREHSIASLEAGMARYQPMHSVVTVPSNSNLAGIGAQFKGLFKGSSPVPVPRPWS